MTCINVLWDAIDGRTGPQTFVLKRPLVEATDHCGVGGEQANPASVDRVVQGINGGVDDADELKVLASNHGRQIGMDGVTRRDQDFRPTSEEALHAFLEPGCRVLASGEQGLLLVRHRGTCPDDHA